MILNDLEKKILGAIIFDNKSIEIAYDIIEPHYFLDNRSAIIYSAMLMLFTKKKPIDSITLYEQLNSTNELQTVGGAGYLSKISLDVYTSANIDYHCKLLVDKWQLNQISKIFSNGNQLIKDSIDPNELIDKTVVELEKLNEIGMVEDKNLKTELPRIMDEIQARKNGTLNTYLRSHYFPSINNLTDGILPGNVIGIEARDKHGKTTLATNLTLDLAINSNEPVAIFSLENGTDELIWKIVSSEFGIEYGKLRNPQGNGLTNTELETLFKHSKKKFENSNIFIYEYVKNEAAVYHTVKRLKKQYGLKWFVVDYIGILDSISNEQTRERKIASMTRFFKTQVAKKLGVNPCLISQQNRQGDTAESLGLRRDCDFLFAVEKPYDLQRERPDFEEIKSIKLNGETFYPNPNHFIVKFRRSRHTEQGGAFLCGYSNNKFREIDPASEQKYPNII